MKYVSSPRPPLEAALSIFEVLIFCLKTNSEKEITKTKKAVIKAEQISFLKMFILKRSAL
jgi:hypothetical protein